MDSQIVRLIAGGNRPPRPPREDVAPWLPDSIWEMMKSCWTEDPSSRSSISQVYDVFSRSAEDVAAPVTGSDTKNGKWNIIRFVNEPDLNNHVKV
jgi:hypothetical protein